MPDEIRDEFAAGAARSGRPLQKHLPNHFVEMASRPSLEEVVARARARASLTGTRLDASDILAARDADCR